MPNPAYYDNVGQHIKTHKFSMVGVFSTKEDPGPSFTYTIGNCVAGLPELLLMGLAGADAGWIVNHLVLHMHETGADVPDGYQGPFQMPLRVVESRVWVKHVFTIQVEPALRYLNLWPGDYRVLQIMLPDRNGKFPGDDGVAPNFDVVQTNRPYREADHA